MMQSKDHQDRIALEGCERLSRGRVILIAGEPRIGKSLPAIAIAQKLGWTNVLVVTKKAAIGGWLELINEMKVNFEVVNYESIQKTRSEGWDGVIVDESHRIGAYPKPCIAFSEVRSRCVMAKGVILLSGTPAIESGAKLYHQFALAGFWDEAGFYKWHNKFGIQKKIKLYGRDVAQYDDVDMDKIMGIVGKALISCTMEEAGMERAEIIRHRVFMDPKTCLHYRNIKRDSISRIDNRVVVGLTAPQQAQILHMMTGGACYDDRGGIVDVGKAKIDYLMKKWIGKRKIVIFTEYVPERNRILVELGKNGTDNLENFKSGEYRFFVGSTKVYCEGTDFSFCDEMVLYSIPWSGSNYVQVLARLSNMHRENRAIINVLVMENTIDEAIFEAVSGKQDFNRRMYNK